MRPIYYSPPKINLSFCNTCSRQLHNKKCAEHNKKHLTFAKFEEWVTTKKDRFKDEMEWRILVYEDENSKNDKRFIPIPTTTIVGMHYFSGTLGLTEHFETISNWAKKHNIQWKCWMKK